MFELVEQAASLLEQQPKSAYALFLRENPDFLRLTTNRATSYWNEYYRKREDYPALRAIATLTAA
jgi:hypothetical protein